MRALKFLHGSRFRYRDVGFHFRDDFYHIDLPYLGSYFLRTEELCSF